MLRELGLFAGIGGFSLGLEMTGGFEPVCFSEIEPYAQDVLRKHWPHVPIIPDVHDVSRRSLEQLGAWPVDVVTGGFPCQDLSAAGKGAGLSGARSRLWWEQHRIIAEIRPRYAIIENVSILRARGLEVVLGALDQIGYDAEWHCIPASSVGALHRRDRLWIIAYPRSVEHEGQGDAVERQRAPRLPEADLVANTDISGLEGRGRAVVRQRSGEQPVGASCTRSVSSGFWFSEPDVGGDPDGFPVWFYRCVGRGLSGQASRRAAEKLRALWGPHVAQALWRCAGDLERVSKAEVLFAFVREYEAGTNQARLLVAGEETSEDFLRSLRRQAFAARSPRRSKRSKQRTVEHSDALPFLSQLLARDCEARWPRDSWEDAVPRTSVDTPARKSRLQCLGNAVVPAIPYLLGQAILLKEKFG